MTAVNLSCALPPSRDTAEQIAIAEKLGYARAWCYDSPALYPDVWMALGLAAHQTATIGLGPAVLVPSLRHPMVNAAAIAGLADLAPGRVAAAIGAGFTGRYTLGRRAMRWSDVADYVRVLRSLLRGEEASWEGAAIKMLERDPVDVPLIIAGDGPKGRAVAAELGDGIFGAGLPPLGDGQPDWRGILLFGTVLDEGEDLRSDRVIAAAGHALAVVYHGLYERSPEAVDAMPGGAQWRAAIEEVPAERRHLAVHEGHLVRVTERDRPAVLAGADLLPAVSFTGTAAQLRERAAELAEAGVTEIAIQPGGPDIAGELERMMAALG